MTSEANCWREHDAVIFAMLYLILLTLWFYKIFKLICLKQSFWPKIMYAKHWTKLAWTTFLENSAIFLVQQLCGALMNSWLLEYAAVFSIKNKFQPIFLTFDFDLSPPPHTHTHAQFTFKTNSLFLSLYTSPEWLPSLLQLPITTGSMY